MSTNNSGIKSTVIFKGKYIISCDLKLETGLHIGEGQNSIEIGGVDNAVIKDAKGVPYIPGSSLKGKMRSLLEFAEGKIKQDDLIITKGEVGSSDRIRMHMCDDLNCAVCNIFGRNHGDHKTEDENKISKNFDKAVMPTRLIVRDARLDENSITQKMKENLDLEWTEVKYENNIDRITSRANPRQNERVPAGAEFKCEFVLNEYDEDDNKYLIKLLKTMKLLEDDYLGGHGSRGYGKVKFKNIKIEYRSKDYYTEAKEAKIICNNINELDDAIAEVKNHKN